MGSDFAKDVVESVGKKDCTVNQCDAATITPYNE